MVARVNLVNVIMRQANLQFMGLPKALLKKLLKKELRSIVYHQAILKPQCHLDPTILNQIVDEIPIGRLGQPAEVAAVVDFLASTDCGFVTGANIDINGGQYFG